MRKYLIIIEKTNNGYSAWVPDLPGCIATGRTKENVEKLIYEAISFHLDGLIDSHLPIPINKTEAANVYIKI
jgi:predicted RNase H-like HicB family nuclease